ncbi:MAG: DUF5113 domain-containing protein, partial [Prevotellaceae bacterium]|nr:DUF5113 domain-containing protein [Prevotellaceae bacterium]
GTVRLHIEHVALSELFDLIEKGARAFELKRLTLEVRPTTAVVKADRALTLFMINTLVENARKFTPPGGRVSVSARVQDEGELIEIAVEDTGIGLTPAEVAHITTDKVYDPHQIGLAQTGNAELLKNKGSGYGLMNCRGIMEKYRKSSPLFRSCTFGVESRVGQGSRFYFRLPSGVRKTVMMLLCACTAGFTFAQTVPADEEGAYEVLLNRASDYADEAYFSNVDGRFEQALCDVDSAIACLNAHYRRYVSTPTDFMTLTGEEEQAQPAELVWWHSTFDSDFHVILDIRNEAAVAFLALKQWDAYYYNNTIYTTLYKLLGEDRSLEAYCRTLERSAGNRQVGILLFIGLVCALLAGYYILYIRKRLANRWNLEQVFEINKQLFAAAVVEEPSEEEVRDIPERMARKAFDAVNELIPINRMLIRVQSDETTPSDGQTDGMLAFPLRVESDADSAYVGTLYLELREVRLSEDMRLLLQLVARYMAIVINNAVVQLSSRYHDIETALDQAARANREDEQLHVQNMVLDNSLSTIKHETSYYPTKIKLLITKLRTGGLSAEAQEETIRSIDELVTYYKGIFTILSRCASRPLEEITFRRTTLEVQQLLSYARQYFQKAIAKTSARITLVVEESGDGCVVGDPTELRYLLECLLDEALTSPLEGTLLLSAADNGDYIRFSFTDRRRNKSTEELNTLFYPHLGQHAVYLVGKQIIREHDEYAGRRGCRINAEQTPGGGFTLYFTIPKKQ